MSTNGNGSDPIAQDSAVVYVEDGHVVVDHYEESDVAVVRVIESAEDPAMTFSRAVQIGCRAVTTAGVSADAAVIDRAFANLERRFQKSMDGTTEELDEITTSLMNGEEGSIPALTEDLRSGIEELLESTFDPESKKSVLAKFDVAMAAAQERFVGAIKKLLDPRNDDGPLGRQHAEVMKAVQDGTESVRQAVNIVSEKVAAKEAKAQIMEKSALKGTPYEDVVHEIVGALAAVHGDAAEKVRNKTGAKGNKRGDELVTLDPDEFSGDDGRIVLELKTGPVGLRNILNELDQAMANREARAAVAVFSSAENAPVAVPFQPFGNRAIIVLDKDDLDDGALRLAYLWARWLVRRSFATEAGDVDTERISTLIGNVQRSLGRVSNVRRAHSTARNKIDEAGGQVTELVGEVEEALVELRTEIAA